MTPPPEALLLSAAYAHHLNNSPLIPDKNMFLLREVHPNDLDELEELAKFLNTVNLPANRNRLQMLIETSRKSFDQSIDNKDREYVFVLLNTDTQQLIGTCMIIAQHGTYRRPSVYFNVLEEQKYSETLDKYFVHQVLQLHFNYDGPTEIGGLILHPDYQGHAQKLGKILSFLRFLFIGMHRSWFRETIIAELLPPLNEDGTSELWNCLGANFTGLDYMTADKLSRQNIEFIRSLFPQTAIYTALLPAPVRELIGQVGAPTKPVEKMLKSIGFRNNNSIDPFDGGPTFAVATDQCELIKRVQHANFSGVLPTNATPDGQALVASEVHSNDIRFRSILATYSVTPDGILLCASNLSQLQIPIGSQIVFLPLNGPELDDLYGVEMAHPC